MGQGCWIPTPLSVASEADDKDYSISCCKMAVQFAALAQDEPHVAGGMRIEG